MVKKMFASIDNTEKLLVSIGGQRCKNKSKQNNRNPEQVEVGNPGKIGAHWPIKWSIPRRYHIMEIENQLLSANDTGDYL